MDLRRSFHAVSDFYSMEMVDLAKKFFQECSVVGAVLGVVWRMGERFCLVDNDFLFIFICFIWVLKIVNSDHR